MCCISSLWGRPGKALGGCSGRRLASRLHHAAKRKRQNWAAGANRQERNAKACDRLGAPIFSSCLGGVFPPITGVCPPQMARFHPSARQTGPASAPVSPPSLLNAPACRLDVPTNSAFDSALKPRVQERTNRSEAFNAGTNGDGRVALGLGRRPSRS